MAAPKNEYDFSKIKDPFAAPKKSNFANIVDPFSEDQSVDTPSLSAPEANGNVFIRGLKSGIHQTVGLGYAGGAMGADLFGSEEGKKAGLEGYRRSMEMAALYQGNIPDFTDLDPTNGGQILDYTLFTLGSLAHNIAVSLASAGVGGLIAGAGGKTAVKKLLADQIAKGASKEVAAKAVGSEIAKRLAREKAGQMAGAAAASIGMETGSIYGETGDAGVAAIHGALAGSIDALPFMRVLSKFGGGKLAKEAKAGIIRSIPKELAVQTVLESGTEALQTLIEQHAKYWVDTNGESLAANLGDVNWKEVKDAAGAGAVGGLFIGGGSEVVSRIGRKPEAQGKPTPKENLTQRTEREVKLAEQKRAKPKPEEIQQEEAQPEKPAEEMPQPKFEKLAGDKDQLFTTLKAAGIKSIKTKDGVHVPIAQAEKARETVKELAARPVEPLAQEDTEELFKPSQATIDEEFLSAAKAFMSEKPEASIKDLQAQLDVGYAKAKSIHTLIKPTVKEKPNAVEIETATQLHGDVQQREGAQELKQAVPAGEGSEGIRTSGQGEIQQEEKRLVQEIDAKANEAATSPKNDLPEPTEAQIEAGNYKKGAVNLHGLNISIENPKGSIRSGTDEDGKVWKHTMSDHYGYIKNSMAADGEQVDTYVGPRPTSDKVYVVDQLKQEDNSFDEHKALIGYGAKEEAVNAYKSNFDKGWKVGPVTEMSIDGFKDWIKGDTTKPIDQEYFADKPVSKEEKRLVQAKAETQRKRTRIDPIKDDLLTAIKKLGGINREEAISEDFRPQDWKTKHNKGREPLFPAQGKGGKTLDQLLENAKEHGYVPQDATLNDFRDKVRSALSGKDIRTPEGAVWKAEEDYRKQQVEAALDPSNQDVTPESVLREPDHLPELTSTEKVLSELVKEATKEGVPPEKLKQIVQHPDSQKAAGQIFAAIDEARSNDAQSRKRIEGSGTPTQEGTGPQARGEEIPWDEEGITANTDEEIDALFGIAPELKLEAQTEESLKQQADKETADAAAKTKEEKKAEIAYTADDFSLTGSNRPADIAMARGQKDIFSEARQEEAQPSVPSTVDLTKVEFTRDVTTQDGSVYEVTESAEVLLRRADKRVDNLEKLLGCLKS